MQEKKLQLKILENTKSKSGITLIALVITIIVLLILAGVALATLTGQGNIIENAENAVGAYNEATISEEKTLNSIEKLFIEKTDRNEPIVKAKQEVITIITGEDYDVSDYFIINKNGVTNIADIKYSIQDTASLNVGEHILTCTATKENGKSASASITIIVKDLEYTEQKFTTAGTHTFTVPSTVKRIRVAVCGGGGGGRASNDNGTAASGQTSSIKDMEQTILIQATGGSGGRTQSQWKQDNDNNWYEYYGYGGTGGSPNGIAGSKRDGAMSAGSIGGVSGFELNFNQENGDFGAGGGASCSRGTLYALAGGGSGGYNTSYIDVTPLEELTITVGAGGGNGTSGFVLIAYGGEI